MTKSEFQSYMYKHIPVTKAMGFEVEKFDKDKIAIKAHLAPNINHKSTAFGGSVSSLLIMCGWGKIRKICEELPSVPHIVIQKSDVEYLKAITQDFTASCEAISDEEIERFRTTYLKFGKARLIINSFIEINGVICAKGTGHYVIF